MNSIVTGTIILGILHALIPNHWLVLVAIAKSEKWSKNKLLLVTSITASAHVLGTVLFAIYRLFATSILEHQYEDYIHATVPTILILFGAIYFIINAAGFKKKQDKEISDYPVTGDKWVWFITIIMFFSPCLEAESLFRAAGSYGFDNIILLALVYALISITTIMLLVVISFTLLGFLKMKLVRPFEKQITGLVFIITGIVTIYLH